jgi:hypothetical protein
VVDFEIFDEVAGSIFSASGSNFVNAQGEMAVATSQDSLSSIPIGSVNGSSFAAVRQADGEKLTPSATP